VAPGAGQAAGRRVHPAVVRPGEAYQFDWSHEIVVLGGVTTTVKVAHVRLCHSRMFLLRAYPRETQEMVFDARDHAFRLFGGAPKRGIYDNMTTAVDAVFIGRDRRFNRRFLQMCSHYLVEPTACTPAAGWEKGQVENQVGNARERFFTPRLRFAGYAELNAWLLDQCIAHAKATLHPEEKQRTVWEAFTVGWKMALKKCGECGASLSRKVVRLIFADVLALDRDETERAAQCLTNAGILLPNGAAFASQNARNSGR